MTVTCGFVYFCKAHEKQQVFMQTVCACVYVCVRERERERVVARNSLRKHKFFCFRFLFLSGGGGRGLSLVSHFDKLWLAAVCNVYNIHAADLSEKCSLWLHGYGKFDMLKLARVCWLRIQLVKSDHCHWTLDRCGAYVCLFAQTSSLNGHFEHRRPNVAYRYIHSAISLLLCEVLKSSSSTFWILPLTWDRPASSHSRSSVFVILPPRYCSLLCFDQQERTVTCSN